MTNFKVHWQHMNNGKGQQSSSHCIIELGDKIIGAVSKVHPNDIFNRKVGIYESFKKAVAKVEPKEDRKILWNDFLSIRKPITSKSRN